MKTRLTIGVVYRQCLKCGHERVDYEDALQNCILCGAQELSPPISLSRIRATLAEGDQKATTGTLSADAWRERKELLTGRFGRAARVFAQRAQELYERIEQRYLGNDLSDRCLDGLVLCFHLFSELGLHDSAVRCALLIGSGYFRRVEQKEIRTLGDLADLAGARQWFLHLHQGEWVATVDLLTGLKAGHTVLENVRDKYLLLQISRVHLHRAREYYATNNLPEIHQRIERETHWINEQLSHAIGAAAQIEAAQINAESRRDAAQIIGRSLDRVADSIEAGFDRVADSIEGGFKLLSARVDAGLDGIGRQIDLAGGRVSAAMLAGSQYIADRTLAAGAALSRSIQKHAESTQQGLHELGSEVRRSLEVASDKASKALAGVGTKIALGTVGAGALHGLLLNGALKEIAGEITPHVREGLENLRLIESRAPDLEMTKIVDARDALVQYGLDEFNRRLRPVGFRIDRAK